MHSRSSIDLNMIAVWNREPAKKAIMFSFSTTKHSNPARLVCNDLTFTLDKGEVSMWMSLVV